MSEEPPVSPFPALTFDLGDVFGRFRTETTYEKLTVAQVHTALSHSIELPQELVADLAHRDANGVVRGLTIRGYDALAEFHHALSDALAAYTGS